MLYSSVLAACGLATVSSAHMIMSTPTPYDTTALNNSPLDASGSDFPCKVSSASGYSYTVTDMNTFELGSTQKLAFTGQSVHGGGSCQVSLAASMSPDNTTPFKVITSIEGGCPAQNTVGNIGSDSDASAADPFPYNFTIPDNIPTGNYTLSWSWLNKVGNREFYQNCAPVSITSGSAKRDLELETRDTSAFDALPDMFVANIKNANRGDDCATVEDTDVIFPSPGSVLQRLGLQTSTALASPSGTCGFFVSGATAAATPASSDAASAATTATPSGGMFATESPSAAAATTIVTSAATPVAASPTSNIVPSSATATPVASASSSSSSSSSGGAMTGACDDEGMWNCIDGSSFQECASGTWSVVQDMAPGTTCQSGQTTEFAIAAAARKHRRALRFSRDHVARHAMHSI